MLRIHEIKLNLGEELSAIPGHIKKKLGMKQLVIGEWKPVKESVDAREKTNIRRVYSVDFSVDEWNGRKGDEAEGEVLRAGEKRKIKISSAPDIEYHYVTDGLNPEGREDRRLRLKHPPVVVGFGPCGMFAALLLAQMGYRPVVLERGKAIEDRVRDVERFWREGVLDPESNVQFGEGGAGSFSDGKLTTQIKDKRIRKVLTELALAGGGEELLYKQKPHVGTDVLREVVRNIREEILRLGGTIEFETCVTGLRFRGGEPGISAGLNGVNVTPEQETGPSAGSCTGSSAGSSVGFSAGSSAESSVGSGMKSDAAAETNTGRVLCGVEAGDRVVETEALVLAPGHSARDTFRMLYERGITMEQKPFSMGARIEHPQAMIDKSQYGEGHEGYNLGAADYKLSWRCKNGRGVYTFCMCPGGRVIASASCEGGVVTNGMSNRSRDMENANSALLVDIRTEDYGSSHPLAGIAFQERYEGLAFEAGGGDYRAPAQRVGDFLQAAESDKGTAAAGNPEPPDKGTAAAAAGNPEPPDKGTAAARNPGLSEKETPTNEEDWVRPSYEPGVTWTSLDKCLPEFVTEAMREALPELGKKLAGFDRVDAVLTGVESRSSSPVRIPRSEELVCNVEGLYPGGEGAGYAGGITSAAVDGIRIAETIAMKYLPALPLK